MLGYRRRAGASRQRRLRARRDADHTAPPGSTTPAADVEPIRHVAALHRPAGRRLHDQRRHGPLRHHPGGADQELCRSGDCYSVTVSVPAFASPQHWDALLQETFSLGLPHTWVLHLGESFPDVPTDHQFYPFIENLFHNGVTGGCAGRRLLPGGPRHPRADGGLPPEVEVRPGPHPAPVHRDRLHRRALHRRSVRPLDRGARGARASPAAAADELYCPSNTVTRQQMAVFLLKAFEGSTYVPPDCAGIFDDVTCTPGTGFSDWIEELDNRGITGGCSMAPLALLPDQPEQPRPDGGVSRQDVRSRALRRLKEENP